MLAEIIIPSEEVDYDSLIEFITHLTLETRRWLYHALNGEYALARHLPGNEDLDHFIYRIFCLCDWGQS
jgi:hypothetical protein